MIECIYLEDSGTFRLTIDWGIRFSCVVKGHQLKELVRAINKALRSMDKR